MVIIVMGVAGCGKTTVGKYLGEHLALPFYDADDFHPASNIALMKAGIPLTDETRRPWLESLAEHIAQWEKDDGAVLACSALKASYRQILQSKSKGAVHILFLQGTKDQIAKRLQNRSGHFMPVSLIDSQFATLEPPDDALVYSLEQPSESIAKDAAAAIRREYAAL